MDRLVKLLAAQRELQEHAMGYDIDALLRNTDTRVEYFKENVLALTDELHEALGEMSWKSWAKSSHFREEAVRKELVDALHFLLNLIIASGMSADELYTRYFAKRAVNAQRQATGYDGVSTKCAQCGRAAEDVSLLVTRRSDGQVNVIYCACGEAYAFVHALALVQAGIVPEFPAYQVVQTLKTVDTI